MARVERPSSIFEREVSAAFWSKSRKCSLAAICCHVQKAPPLVKWLKSFFSLSCDFVPDVPPWASSPPPLDIIATYGRLIHWCWGFVEFSKRKKKYRTRSFSWSRLLIQALAADHSTRQLPISAKMNPLQLPPSAETVRIEIKEIIPETATSSNRLPEIKTEIRDDGNKTYLGTLLAKKISLLTKEMLLGDVRTSVVFWSPCLI